MKPYGSKDRRSSWFTADGGGATAFVCVALAGLICLTLLVGQVGVAVVARHRAQGAADLGALAAAGLLAESAETACGEAGEIARRMGVRVRRCSVAQWDVVVDVEVNVSAGVFGMRTVQASARAGPVEENE
ncbi:Rv3654c family TadE-like protein [Nocardia sp. NPDC003183]